MLGNTHQTWGSITKTLHWTMAFLIFTQFGLGWVAVSWRLSPTKLNLFVWHKSIGLLILALALIRLVWRLANPVPQLPTAIAQWERYAAHTSHWLLYFSMIGMPLSGWIINSAANIPFRIFWAVPLPAIVPASKPLEELAKLAHLSFFSLLCAVLVVHIGAALRHHFIKGNNILRRMLPGRSSSG